jgi:hypothetical protein
MIVYAWKCSGCDETFIFSERAHRDNKFLYDMQQERETRDEPTCGHEVECNARLGVAAGAKLRPFAQWSAELIP